MRAQVIALTVCLVASPLYAQSISSRGSASAVGGVATTYDDESRLGRGWLAGGALDHVVFGTTRAEVSVEVVTHDRASGYLQSSGQTVIGGVSVVQRFGKGSTQPYVLGGLTVAHHSATNTFAGDARKVSQTTAGMRFGAGVAFRAGDRLELGPELRINSFFGGSDLWLLPSVGMRVGWRR